MSLVQLLSVIPNIKFLYGSLNNLLATNETLFEKIIFNKWCSSIIMFAGLLMDVFRNDMMLHLRQHPHH